MEKKLINIFWFRRDLRIDDNRGLFEAFKGDNKVLPIFIFDKNILEDLEKDDARVTFIYGLLEEINNKLKAKHKSLAVFHDTPLAVFEKLIKEYKIGTVYTNHDYEPYSRKRDLAVFQIFKEHGIGFKTYKDQVIFEKSEVVKEDQTPYVVFTPYSKKWKENFRKKEIEYYNSEDYINTIIDHSYPFPDLVEIGFKVSSIKVNTFDISSSLIQNYEKTRNFPALHKTSGISTYLRFGAISIRMLIGKIIQEENETYWNELIWREFFMQILWHFPYTATKSFRPKYDGIQWNNNEEEFKKWCEGKTGYPFVDAGMRELNKTGLMHNRVRMIVASFLCKHLLIDWRWGEAYFAVKLLDYEMSSNIGNWQWAAGSGVDAAPYFRIFNPTEQVKKFDKDLNYIKKWVPELGYPSYPEPIIDHKFARERCLMVYKEAVG